MKRLRIRINLLFSRSVLWGTLFLFLPILVMAQPVTIKGKVTDAITNEALPGVSVVVEGAPLTGTATSVEGNYTITVPSSTSVLVFSFIGYTTEKIAIQGRTEINVPLAQFAEKLSEVVVTGYTTEKKKDITGAVAVVKMKDIASIPTGNVMSSLVGRLPGVNISTDGTPGGVNTGVLIRGTTTINNSSPLYVIDGVQTRANVSTLLNANDIESIQVLEDAASASIYGVQAANGVIIITTKKADKKGVKVDFDAQFSAQTFHTNITMLNAQQWGDVYWQAYLNDGVKPSHDLYGSGATPVIPEFIDSKKTIRSGDTDWAKEVYHTSLLQNYNLSVSKGADNGSSTFSLNYFDQDGLVKYTNFKRLNSRFKSDYNFLDNRFRVGENVNLSYWSQILQPGGIEELTIAQHPIIPVYDIYGGYAGPTLGIGDKPNPVRLLDQQKDNRFSNWRIFGNMWAEVEPIKNLVFRSNFGLNYRSGFQSNFSPKWSEGDRIVDKNSLFTQADYDKDWTWSNTLTYNFKIKEHSVNLLAGSETKETVNEYINATRESFLVQALDYRYMSAGSGKQTNDGLASRAAWISYFGKINYSFMDRYLLSGTLRRDASSRFGLNNNSAVFPAVTAGWRISQEDFIKNIPLISDLKLRASWGKNGNDQIDNEATYTKYVTNIIKTGYDMAGLNQGVIYNGIMKDRSGNPDIRWEVTTQKNIGLDLSMLNSRLSLTLDYYIKDTKDMLIERPYIGVIGEGGYMAYNGASMTNKGFNFIASWRDKIGTDINYDATFTGSVNRNEITYLPDDIKYTWGGGNGVDKTIVGQPYGSWFGYKTDGLFKTAEEVANSPIQSGKGLGRIRYVDVNGDGKIDSKDMTWLGSDQPKFTGSLNLGLTYKSFDLSLLAVGMVRNAYNNSKFYTDFFQLWTGNHSTRLLNAWTPQNSNSDIPALTAVNLNDEGRSSEYFIEDGSYMKLKNIVIGYTLPKELAAKFKLRNMRVYVQGQDLFTITKYKGADPEGLGYPYPLPRTFTFGLNLGF
ncbi:MAG: TonB-dependent receptor [Bacteroidota bacterium]|nr:TonB-dependent receptor [Bacteroidota bacterium]